MKFLKIIAIIGGIYVALALILDSAIGYFQPQGDRTAVLRTFDEAGESYDRVMLLLNDDGQLWVESGHWFRGWYHQALANPNVVLIQDGQETPYVAVPVNTPETVDMITRLMGKGSDFGYWVGRTILMFAPIKPLRLDAVSTPQNPDGSQQDLVGAEQEPAGVQPDSVGAEQDSVHTQPDPVSVQQDPIEAEAGSAGVQEDQVDAGLDLESTQPDPDAAG